MKKFYLVAVAALSLASCSNDDVVDLQQQDVIKFNAVAENASRAADVYCNNNMPEDFLVSAYLYTSTDTVAYFENELVKKSGSSYVPTVERYWPEEGELKFIATKNMPSPTKISVGGNWLFDNLQINEDVTKQVDMLFAVTPNQTKATNAAGGVNLNFRHLLSQIVFSARNANNNLHVEVSGVKVVDAPKDSVWVMFGSRSTEENYVNHEGSVTEPDSTRFMMVLNPELVAGADFVVNFDEPIVVGTELTSLTSANAEGKEFSNTAMLLFPLGAHGIAVNCTIWNIAGDTFNETTDTKVYEGWHQINFEPANAGRLWLPGHKYTYTFVFGGDILDPITYNVTVDDFQAVANQDVEVGE